MSSDFEEVFTKLKGILSLYADGMDVVTDDDSEFFINTRFMMKNKKPLYFGSVKINKKYVSYHLMPVYAAPSLLEHISAGLRKRMQGKSCFNFKVADDDLFAELAELTKNGYESYKEAGYL